MESTTKQRLLTAGILLVMFLAAMDNMITSTIMPSVISSVGGLSLYPWIGTVFMLTTTITTPLYGKLSDLYGHKRFVLIAIGIFMLGSMLCGMAQTMEQLILFRGIQGIGGGGLVTMSFIVFGILFSPEKRAKMQSALSSVWAVASVVGPAVGAFFVETLTWRWAFYVNLPIGLLSAWTIIMFLKVPKEQHTDHRIDYGGAALFASGGILLLFGLLETSQGMSEWINYAALGLGILLLIWLVFHERNEPEPIIPIALFSNKNFLAPVLLGFIAGSTLFSISNLTPLFIQGALGESAGISGRVVTGISFGWVTGSLICGRLLNKTGFRTISIFGALFMLVGLFLMKDISLASAWWHLFIYNIILGFGMGLIATTTLVAVQSAVSKRTIGAATSTNQLFRSVGGTIGLSVLGGLQLGHFQQSLTKTFSTNAGEDLQKLVHQPHLILDPANRAILPADALEKVSQALSDSVQEVFLIAFVVSFLVLIWSWQMPKETPEMLAATVEAETKKSTKNPYSASENTAEISISSAE
ncbi:major facilitator superfamily MFS_1 [Chloroherpeton thalassium ATCC 35110]|uniref:Major facilitator superfamily MFS_1 n=1 Tax=Chloroherpeton thalassium (strain ATCC 35110 / GB-78) TaxID=517418 RepID=B3QX01_CHLT3|nr:MDR family MFS transporter [Chloroherpeton thalassium]ACF13365.1 major facilitator superfamily MFS_1 [Chloroherpeton thalassium ATCC 35110]